MSEFLNHPQLTLFDLSDTVEDVLEIFPEVWKALEMVISSNVENRIQGLREIVRLNAHRLSPIVAYVLATSLDDPNIDFRYEVVQAVGELLSRDSSGLQIPIDVKLQVKYYLGQMRKMKVFALLQVADYQPSSIENVAVLLKNCSYSGQILGDIFTDYKLPIKIRRQGIYFAGYLGFIETVPRLEKLEDKIESRLNGQKAMPFVPKSSKEDILLLPTIRKSLELLKTP